MNFDEDSNLGTSVLKRLSVNTRLSNAKIFEEDSDESSNDKKNIKNSGKMKSTKKNIKGSPYKTDSKKNIDYESDPDILQRRQKQIDYGKNTIGYDTYISQVPINKRKKEHPRTPNKYQKYSRRGWDCLIKIWRMKLHEFDPKYEEENGESSTIKELHDNSDNVSELSL